MNSYLTSYPQNTVHSQKEHLFPHQVNSKLIKLILLAYTNAFFPTANETSLGRSHQSLSTFHTLHRQACCFFKAIITNRERKKLWKISLKPFQIITLKNNCFNLMESTFCWNSIFNYNCFQLCVITNCQQVQILEWVLLHRNWPKVREIRKSRG